MHRQFHRFLGAETVFLGHNNGIFPDNCIFFRMWYNVHEDKECLLN